MIAMIYATDDKRLIGVSEGNKLPWHNKNDLKYFKKMTSSSDSVLMGHTTYMSLKSYYKNKPLPFKKIYVANLEDYDYPDAELVKHVPTFLYMMLVIGRDVMVIGGATIYKLAMPYVDRAYVTYISGEHEGDVYLDKSVEFEGNRDFETVGTFQLDKDATVKVYQRGELNATKYSRLDIKEQ